MEEVMTKPKQSYVFDRKLTDEEIRRLIDDFDYDAWLEDYENDDGTEPEPLWDRFGNPTRDTIAAKYEAEHDIGEIMTVEEAIAEIHAACSGKQSLQEGFEARR